MYQNDGFLQMKAQYEKELIMQTKFEMERKFILGEADRIINEQKEWREKREADREEEKKVGSDSEDELYGQIRERSSTLEEDP